MVDAQKKEHFGKLLMEMKSSFDMKFEELRQIMNGSDQRDCPICNLRSVHVLSND